MLLTLKLRKQNVTNKQSCDVSRKSLRPQDGNLVDDHKRRYNFVIIDVVDCMPESHHWHNMLATWRKCDACVLRATQRTTQESGFQRRLPASQRSQGCRQVGFCCRRSTRRKKKDEKFLFFFFSVFNTSFFVSHLSLRTELSDCMLLAAGKYTRKSKSGKEKQIEWNTRT